MVIGRRKIKNNYSGRNLGIHIFNQLQRSHKNFIRKIPRNKQKANWNVALKT